MKWLALLIGSVGTIFLAFFKAQRQATMPIPAPKPTPMPTPAPTPPPAPPTPLERVYGAAAAHIGAHLTLNPAVPPEVGCVEALSVILKDAGYELPPKGIEGVNALIAWMLAKGFKEMSIPLAGAIITSHSLPINEVGGGHCGVVMNFGICSNNSANGIWEENYASTNAWRAYFVGKLHYDLRYFRPV